MTNTISCDVDLYYFSEECEALIFSVLRIHCMYFP